MEGVVIVGSILLAFGIQAWWEERGDGIRREALLDALQSDMAVAAIEVDRVVGLHAEGREAAAAVLNLGPEAPLSAGQAYLVDSLVAATFSSPSYDAPLGALDALLSSGELEVLDDADLASGLTAFPALVANLDREQGLLQSKVVQLDEYLWNKGIDTSNLNASALPWETHATATFALAEDAGFRGLARALWYRYRNTSVILGEMREAIDGIQSHLGAETGGR